MGLRKKKRTGVQKLYYKWKECKTNKANILKPHIINQLLHDLKPYIIK
jgi:hypothetical protein